MTATATPKLDRTMRLRDGRQISYAEWGDLQGRPVVLLHGEPGSRLLCLMRAPRNRPASGS